MHSTAIVAARVASTSRRVGTYTTHRYITVVLVVVCSVFTVRHKSAYNTTFHIRLNSLKMDLDYLPLCSLLLFFSTFGSVRLLIAVVVISSYIHISERLKLEVKLQQCYRLQWQVNSTSSSRRSIRNRRSVRQCECIKRYMTICIYIRTCTLYIYALRSKYCVVCSVHIPTRYIIGNYILLVIIEREIK